MDYLAAVICPRCQTEQPDAPECRRCGVIVAKALARQAQAPRLNPEPPPREQPAARPEQAPTEPAASPRAPRVRMSLAQRRNICHALAQLFRAGISPTAALNTVASNAPRGLRPALEGARQAILGGASLTAALQGIPSLLGPVEGGLLFASEQVGAQDRALAEIASGFDDRIALRRRLVVSLIYPSLIFLVAILVAPLIETVGELGILGLASGGLGTTYVGKVVPRVLILAGAVLGLVLLTRVLARNAGLRRWLWAAPWPGTLYVRAVRGRYARMLGRAIEAGLGLPQATALAVRAADDPRVTDAATRLCDPTQPSLMAALESAQLIAPEDRILVASAEQAGTLVDSLALVATRQATAVERGLGHLTWAISFVALLGAGALAANTVSEGHAMVNGQTDQLMKQLEKELPPGFTLD